MDTLAIKALLDNPIVKNGTLADFNSQEEAEYLSGLISSCPAIQNYEFVSFIAAGGSGMVFKVKRNQQDSFFTSLKIVRKAIFENPDKSPFSDEELDALKELVHGNILRQYEFVESPGKGTVAICAALISNPQGLDEYVRSILNQTPKSQDKYSQISLERLNNACETIIAWFYQIAQAVQYMHEQGYYHMDIKPANILIHRHGNADIPIITDMGSCIKENDSTAKRVHFTWAYAHPELTDMQNRPGSIEGGGLRASADIPDKTRLPIYDLYALGRTIQQILAVIENHFGEMSFSNYKFRYMHIIAALLLDGKNTSKGIKKRKGIEEQHNVIFVSDFPMEVHESIFSKKKIKTANELVERLKRYRCEYSIDDLADEFSLRNSQVLNNTIGDLVPFSYRVSRIFNHPTLKRLYGEPQLGLMTEVYPGASHNRWSHSVGVYSLVLKYYTSILSDPENPLPKILINRADINHAMIAAILHDVGQTSLGHDLEAANFDLFNHTSYIMDLIKEEIFNGVSLEKLINEVDAKHWGKIDFKRITSIIEGKSSDPIDFIATDSINSPIDADKLDYIKRDSYYCGVSYGSGIDYNRFMNSLTVKEFDNKIRLAYYFKGRTAISSMLLARYQLYGSVYWHHTYRCLHSMLYYATQLAFGRANYNGFNISINKSKSINMSELRKLYYYRVICKLSWAQSWEKIGCDFRYLKAELKENCPIFQSDFALDFIYRFTDPNGKILLENIYHRKIFKRVYSKSLQEVDTSLLAQQCENRVEISKLIQKRLFDTIKSERAASQRTETSAEIMVSDELVELETVIDNKLFVLVDFPQKVQINKNTWPKEIDDSSRKLQNYGRDNSTEILTSSNRLLSEVACLRVYANPKFFSIITRYLHPETIENCVKNVISSI